MGKLGTVTDLASVCLRSISAGLKFNTTSCSTLLHIYPYSKTSASQAHADDIKVCSGCLFHVKLERLIYRNITVDSCTQLNISAFCGFHVQIASGIQF